MWSHAASASYRQRLDEINRAAPQILRTAHHDFERPSPGTDVGLMTNQLISDVMLDAGAPYGSGNLVIRWLSGGYYFTVYISRLPSFSHRSESIGEHRDFGEHGGEPFDQGDQPLLRHGWDEIVEHGALAEQ